MSEDSFLGKNSETEKERKKEKRNGKKWPKKVLKLGSSGLGISPKRVPLYSPKCHMSVY